MLSWNCRRTRWSRKSRRCQRCVTSSGQTRVSPSWWYFWEQEVLTSRNCFPNDKYGIQPPFGNDWLRIVWHSELLLSVVPSVVCPRIPISLSRGGGEGGLDWEDVFLASVSDCVGSRESWWGVYFCLPHLMLMRFGDLRFSYWRRISSCSMLEFFWTSLKISPLLL